jgi:hypothetical protein
VRFRATIQGTGKNTTGIPVPEAVMAGLGGGRRPQVQVTIGGHSYRSSVATVDAAPMISLSADNREKAGVSAGDEVEVDVELDTAPRQVSVPSDLAAALAADPDAQLTWEGFSYSNKQWHVLSIEGAKSEETRQRRVAKSVATLHEGRAR